MKYSYKVVTFLAFFLLITANLQAAASDWEADKAHSRFGFEARHIFSSVYGYFEEYTADVKFDPDKLDQSSMNFNIAVKSVQTFIGKRDNHLRSPDFFDVKKFPNITFVSTSFNKVSDERYDVAGMLTIKDVSEDIVLPFTLLGFADNPLDPKKQIAGFGARLTLDRLHYNVGNGKFFKMGIVGQDVQVIISLELLRDK